MRSIEEIKQALLSRRKITSKGCWEYTGHRDSNGYGWARWKGKRWVVSRLYWHLVHGEIPPYIEILHKPECNNPPCFNDGHLYPGTKSDNRRDVKRARRLYEDEEEGL